MLNLTYFETVRQGNETVERQGNETVKRGNLGPVFHSHLIVNGHFFFLKEDKFKIFVLR